MNWLNTISNISVSQQNITTQKKSNDGEIKDRVELKGTDKGVSDLEKDLAKFKAAKMNIEEPPEDVCLDGTPYQGDMPTERQLREAFDKAMGTVSQGNGDDCISVIKFKELFDKDIAKPGDIILIARPSKGEFHPLSKLVPGKYSHVAVYLGKNEKGEAQSVDAWHPSAPIRNIDWWPKSYNSWCIIRPHHADGTEITDEERKKVVDFAKSATGCAYNFNWPRNKIKLPVEVGKTKFYCSQLAWASYNEATGINLDANPGFHPKYAWGVAPQELRDSPLVSVIGEMDYKPPKEEIFDEQ